ncbi:hypothetical protein PIB30_083721 [Stylosanthes scabra]|uniref:Gag protein n=2 Tax=Stylosanthes scabra TaxID=79078 RepID=A0ABU6XRZ2_9FABA|nr:hypothetical protein [Stylosanthes scabra]
MATRGRGRNTASTSSGSEPNAIEILTAINTMAAAMRDTAAATNRAVDQMNLNGNPNNNVPEDESDGGNGRPMTLATFLKVKPPEFKGTVNVTEADDWFQAMERSLQAQRVPAEQYVEFATYMLQGEAQH